MHLVGFIIRTYYESRSHECQICGKVWYLSQSVFQVNGLKIATDKYFLCQFINQYLIVKVCFKVYINIHHILPIFSKRKKPYRTYERNKRKGTM